MPSPSLPARAALAAIAGYRRWLSPLLGPRCRFHPSCSCYANDAIVRHGAARGSVLAFFRILRCNPLCEGGIDPVPAEFPRRFWRRPPPLKDETQ